MATEPNSHIQFASGQVACGQVASGSGGRVAGRNVSAAERSDIYVTLSGSGHSRPANPPSNRNQPPESEFCIDNERAFLRAFPDDDACLDYLLRLRFGTRIECPKCERTAKFHKMRQIPAYACQWCGYHLHPMAQTRFAHTRVGLRAWFHAVFLYSCGGNGVSACELQRLLGLNYKTAWRMRNTIIDAKFNLPRHWRQENQVDFEVLLAALTTSKEPKRPKRSHPRKAA